MAVVVEVNKMAKKKEKKPNYFVSIDDGYCEWKYPLYLSSDTFSIQGIYESICVHFGVVPRDGYITKQLEDGHED